MSDALYPWQVTNLANLSDRVTTEDGTVTQERPKPLRVEPLPVIEPFNAVAVRCMKLQLISPRVRWCVVVRL